LAKTAMMSLYAYTDFRAFLADYYSSRKEEDPAFSFKTFSERSGFKNKSVIFNVIKGRANLSPGSARMTASAMGLKDVEKDYFEALVQFNQAGSMEDRSFYFGKLESLRGRGVKTGPIPKIRKEQHEFYSKLHHSVIRSLLDLHPFKDDYKWLARMVVPPIRPLQAKKSVQLLEKLGLIRKTAGGQYKVVDKLIEADREVVQHGTSLYRLESAELAKQALKRVSERRQSFSGLTLGITEACFEAIVRETDAFQDRILRMAEEDQGSDIVYQYNFQIFPVSKRMPKRASKSKPRSENGS
jgi:uncharacterized protein (TIGR02147 family)